MSLRLLLISNSTLYGSGYLDHAATEIGVFLGPGVRRVLFVPFALRDWEAYAERARERFAQLGVGLDSVHEAGDPRAAVESAEAVFVGGGNTFRLLAALYRFDLLITIRRRVARGTPYIGSSAGSIVACPTLKTTKDMPIVEPPSFEALGLVDFQISPHYLDPEPASTHMGETQEERILQYLEENERPVAGLREGAILRVEDGSVVLKGSAGARIFRRGCETVERRPVAEIGDLLRFSPEVAR
ncbi:MAG: dipeptidase PepE [Thermoanaerobaculia bacterium]